MKQLVWVLIILLMILHQDVWLWQRYNPLVLGFIPIGLAWHAGISISAAVVGLLAARYCWPVDVDVDDQPHAPDSRRGSVDR